MYLRDFIRFRSQPRTLFCYAILSIWIFLLIVAMYKFVTVEEDSVEITDEALSLKPLSFKSKKNHYRDCNFPENIKIGDEGGNLDDGWSLQGVVVLTRNGLRGSMSHVNGANNCDNDGDDFLLNKYRNFVQNLTSISNSTGWSKLGPFHGFPLLPATPKACFLGQLTSKGVAQMLKVGEILRAAYMSTLVLYQKTLIRSINNTDVSVFDPDEILIYSTRYRRTFQSAMALMYAFNPERWSTLNIQESHSYSFCFSDCACHWADEINKRLNKNRFKVMNQHPNMDSMIQFVGNTILQNPMKVVHALEVRDAILSFHCHNQKLPCRRDENSEKPRVTTDIADVINIDENLNENQQLDDVENSIQSVDDEEQSGCINQTYIDSIIGFTRWQETINGANQDTQNLSMVKAYGLIRQLTNYILKMISGDKAKFILLSAHEKTLKNLATSLGIKFDSPFIPFASRLIFEVYKSDKDTQFYFRTLFNGVDITNTISFCEGEKSLRVSRGNRKSKADLCPIENIIRFIHDDYFQSMNATNFKDACYVKDHDLGSYFQE